MILVNIEMQHIVFRNLSFNVPNNILVVFRNDSNYDHSFFNKLAIAFEGRFECQNLFCFNRKITEKC